MKKFPSLFSILIASTALFACSEDPEPVPACGVAECDSIAVADLITAFSLDETAGLKANDIDTWKGVSLQFFPIEKKFRVVGIEFNNASQKKGLAIPATVANLTHMQSFILKVTDCTKPVLDNAIFTLPLEKLVVCGTYAKTGGANELPYKSMGDVPADLMKLKSTVKDLQLSLRLGGDIPAELADWNANINLSDNAFTGMVPLFVRDFKNPLDLSGCQFTDMDWRIYTEEKGNIPNLTYNLLPVDVSDDIIEKFTEVLRTNYFPQYNLQGEVLPGNLPEEEPEEPEESEDAE
ncbi:MAG: hypothetical protein K2I69_04630 [Muribaculaceae bacterium]|nr:hypothetical protein [Muribaculaceae bacterium]